MKKYYKRIIGLAVLIMLLPLFSTGFEFTSNADDSMEEIIELLRHRTEIMQKVLFEKLDEYEGFSCLQQVEEQPLLKEDMEILRLYKDTDLDRIVKMSVEEAAPSGKNFDTYLYHVTIKWYLRGNSGPYTETIRYNITACRKNGNLRLVGMTIAS